jgi:hypothetical protein
MVLSGLAALKSVKQLKIDFTMKAEIAAPSSSPPVPLRLVVLSAG